MRGISVLLILPLVLLLSLTLEPRLYPAAAGLSYIVIWWRTRK